MGVRVAGTIDWLSDEWFERAAELVAPCSAGADVGCRVQFDADGRRWFQVVEEGSVTAWSRGELTDADVELRLPLSTARAIFEASTSGTDALAACTVVAPDGTSGAPSPMDVELRPELQELPELPDATLGIQYHFADGPFGAVDYWWRFLDGRSDQMGWGLDPEPDVEVWIPFHHMVGVRTGAISIYEALEGGNRVDGAVGPLMLLAGLQESEELHDAELACGPSGPVLAALGRLRASEGYLAAMDRLAGETG